MLHSTSASLSPSSSVPLSKNFSSRKFSEIRGRFFRRSVAVASVNFSVDDVADVLQNKVTVSNLTILLQQSSDVWRVLEWVARIFQVLISSVVACSIGQLSKPFTSALRGNGFDLGAVVRSGGMPSSHSAVFSSFFLVNSRNIADEFRSLICFFFPLSVLISQGVTAATTCLGLER